MANALHTEIHAAKQHSPNQRSTATSQPPLQRLNTPLLYSSVSGTESSQAISSTSGISKKSAASALRTRSFLVRHLPFFLRPFRQYLLAVFEFSLRGNKSALWTHLWRRGGQRVMLCDLLEDLLGASNRHDGEEARLSLIHI